MAPDHRDADILVVDKPAGLAVHGEDGPSVHPSRRQH